MKINAYYQADKFISPLLKIIKRSWQSLVNFPTPQIIKTLWGQPDE
jgi:hypothetical protein